MSHSFTAFRTATQAALLLSFAAAAVAQPAAAPAAAAHPPARNVYMAGADVRPAGPVAGDLVAAGGRVVVDQPIAEDATIAAASVDVRASVGDDLRAAGASIAIDARIGGDLAAAAADVALRPAATVHGDATLRGAAVSVQGSIQGDLKATAATVRIDGEVRGTTQVVADRVELGPNARLLGGLVYASPTELQRAGGAVVEGPITREQAGASTPRQGGAAPAAGAFAGSFVALLACAALFLALLPDFAEGATARLRAAPSLSLATGLLLLLAVPPVAVLLFMTLLGIPLALLLLAAFPVLMLAGFVVGMASIADLLAARSGRAGTAHGLARFGWFALALAATLLLGLVPFAGAPILACVAVGGLGAGMQQVLRRGGPRLAVPASRIAPDGSASTA